MPCGGIIAVGPLASTNKTTADKASYEEGGCFICHHAGCRHYCDEWDCMLHAICAIKFLQTDEGSIVIRHGHVITLDFSLEPDIGYVLAMEQLKSMSPEQFDVEFQAAKELIKKIQKIDKQRPKVNTNGPKTGESQ